jgi:hypothetical protein
LMMALRFYKHWVVRHDPLLSPSVFAKPRTFQYELCTTKLLHQHFAESE